MIAPPPLPDSTAHLVRDVHELLGALIGELRIIAHPRVFARAALGRAGDYGWTAHPYNDEAFRRFNDLLHQDAIAGDGSGQTLHHLAIMHHARAFDLECSPQPTKSDADWETALNYWHQICMREGFWVRIGESLGLSGKDRNNDMARAEALAKVRRQWPIRLLRVHMDIALDLQTPSARIAFHVGLVHKSPFSEKDKNGARQEAYESWMSRIDTRVWNPGTRDPEILRAGVDRIQAYLARDPGCFYALADLLRLQERILQSQSHSVGALAPDSPERRDTIEAIRRENAPFIVLFDQLLAPGTPLDLDARRGLRSWFEIMGTICRAMSRYSEALPLYEKALALAADDEERVRLDEGAGETLALEARTYCAKSDPAEEARGKALVGQALARRHLSICALRILANALLLVREWDRARELCDRALACETRHPQDLEEQQQVRELLDDIAVSRSKGQIQAYMENQQFAEALPLLERLLAKSPGNLEMIFWRAQCYLAANRFQEARKDLAKGRKIGREIGNASAVEAADALEKALSKLEEETRNFGVDGRRLRQEAIKANNENRFDEACALLRTAISQARNGTPLRKELSMVLANAAAAELTDMMKAGHGGRHFRGFSAAVEKLRESIELDPSNREARKMLDQLSSLLPHV